MWGVCGGSWWLDGGRPRGAGVADVRSTVINPDVSGPWEIVVLCGHGPRAPMWGVCGGSWAAGRGSPSGETWLTRALSGRANLAEQLQQLSTSADRSLCRSQSVLTAQASDNKQQCCVGAHSAEPPPCLKAEVPSQVGFQSGFPEWVSRVPSQVAFQSTFPSPQIFM
jgi:hypothetical protein